MLRGGRPVNFYSIQFLQIVINKAARIVRRRGTVCDFFVLLWSRLDSS
jgi:hypothetical protein